MTETLETNQERSEVAVKGVFFDNLEDQSRFVALLKTAGIVEARISYNGGGDDGSVDDEAEFFDANGKPVEPPPGLVRVIDSTGWGSDPGEIVEANLHKAVQTMCYRALDQGEWDWVNNEGGYGTLHIDFTTSPFSIQLEHYQRVESVEEHAMEW